VLLAASARKVGAAGPDTAIGSGIVDLTHALLRAAPAPDTAEPNDDPAQAGHTAALLSGLGSRQAAVRGRLSRWSDPRDVYRVSLAEGDSLAVDLSEPEGSDLDLVLWNPGVTRSFVKVAAVPTLVAASATDPDPSPSLTFEAVTAGVYTIEVRSAVGGGRYRLMASRIAAAG